MSLTSGSEIMPSGRTGTTRLSSGFFHTWTSSTSSGPIRKASPNGSTMAGAGAAGWAPAPLWARCCGAAPPWGIRDAPAPERARLSSRPALALMHP